MVAELLLLIGIRVGLGRVLQRPAVTRGIGLIGGVMLLYFAWGMVTFTSSPAAGETRVAHPSCC